MPGKPNKPLFELLREPRRPGARERADAYSAAAAANAAATASADVESKPDPNAPGAARPSTPSRIEVMKPGLAARDAEAAKGAEPFVRVRMTAVYLTVAAVFLLSLGVWVIAYTRGKNVGAADSERKLGVLNQPAQPPDDPLNTKLVTPADAARQDQASPAPAPSKAADNKKAAAKPNPKKAPASTADTTSTAAQVGAGAGEILTVHGRTSTDPRAPDINYLALATLSEDDGAEAVAFLSRNGLDSFAVPNKGDRRAASGRKTVVLMASTGITAEQYKKDPIKTQLEQTAKRLGETWKKQGGSVDFGQAYWQKYTR